MGIPKFSFKVDNDPRGKENLVTVTIMVDTKNVISDIGYMHKSLSVGCKLIAKQIALMDREVG